jgi:hypothetical protein
VAACDPKNGIYNIDQTCTVVGGADAYATQTLAGAPDGSVAHGSVLTADRVSWDHGVRRAVRVRIPAETLVTHRTRVWIADEYISAACGT